MTQTAMYQTACTALVLGDVTAEARSLAEELQAKASAACCRCLLRKQQLSAAQVHVNYLCDMMQLMRGSAGELKNSFYARQ